jgi:hypothetical protein
MKVTHELSFFRRCPVDDAQDFYECKVETAGLLKVEDILAAVGTLPEKAFQEEITVALAANLKCRVTTIGFHKGIKTTCSA